MPGRRLQEQILRRLRPTMRVAGSNKAGFRFVPKVDFLRRPRLVTEERLIARHTTSSAARRGFRLFGDAQLSIYVFTEGFAGFADFAAALIIDQNEAWGPVADFADAGLWSLAQVRGKTSWRGLLEGLAEDAEAAALFPVAPPGRPRAYIPLMATGNEDLIAVDCGEGYAFVDHGRS